MCSIRLIRSFEDWLRDSHEYMHAAQFDSIDSIVYVNLLNEAANVDDRTH